MDVKSRKIPCAYQDTKNDKLQKLADVKIDMYFTRNGSLIQMIDATENYLLLGIPYDAEELRALKKNIKSEAEKKAMDTLCGILGI